MAKPRVVVEGLKGAIQQVRPTVPGSYGTTPVNVIQTPSWQDTQLGQLARVLGVGVQVAGEVKQIGDIKEQEAIDALADKSIEEVNAEALQNRNEFDKLNRKLNLPFMSNPWNQERVRKAAGAQFHDEFQLRLQQALDKSDAATATDTVVQDVITGMTEDYESLKDITIRQGFDAATKSTIQQYSLRYNALKNQQNENELFRGGRSVMFNGATLITDQNGVTKMADSAAIDEWWEENEGALKPARLAELRKTVATDLAYRDPDSARAFLKHTQGFKAGTTKMGDPDIKDDDVFSMYAAEEAAMYEAIDKIELADQTKNVHAAKQEFATIEAEAFEIANTLRNGQSYVGEGDLQITTRIEAENYLLNKLQQSDNVLVKGFSGAQTIKKGLALLEMPEDDNFIQLKENYARAYSGENSFKFRQDTIKQSFLSQYLIEDLSGKTTLNPRYELLFNEVVAELARERGYKLQEISKGVFTDVNNNQITSSKQAIQFETMRGWDDFYLKELSSRLEQRASQAESKIEVSKQIKADTTSPEKISEIVSFVEPSKTISEATTYWFEPNSNFADLEEAARKGENKKVEEIVKRLESESRPVLVGGDRGSFLQGTKHIVRRANLLDSTLNIITSTKSTKEEVESAKRKIALYATVKGLFNATNIKAGSIRVGTRDIAIDREALKSLSLIYPLISKERLIELAKPGDKDTPQEQELFEALYNVTLDENDPNDKKLLEKFITEQAALANRIYKN